MGYCLGIKHEFNICLDSYRESHALMDMFFERVYKKHLEHISPLGQVGVNMVQGAFIGKLLISV